jgi:2-dehydropantoate 2-reductase
MRASVGEIVRTDEGERFISHMLDECSAVAKACGHAPQPDAQANARATLTDRQSNISASMLRDIQRGGDIEGDHIVGDLIRRGREHGVPTPSLEVAYIHLQAYQNRSRTGRGTAQ